MWCVVALGTGIECSGADCVFLQQIDLNNLAGVAASDLAIISKAAQVSEQAEIATGGFSM